MWERIKGVTIQKPAALAAVLLVAVMPWFQGGKDPLGWMILLGVGLLGGFVAWRSQDRAVNSGHLGWAWLALIGWTALSLTWTVNRFQTISWLLLWIFIGIIFVLARSIRKRSEATAILINGYLLVAAIASVYGIILFIFETYNRATSTFYLANPFAGFLLAAIIIGLWRFAEYNRLSDGLVTMLNLSAFILADSRGAGLVLVIAIFLALWLSRQMFKHWRRVLIVLIGALALTLILNLGRSAVTHQYSFQGARFTDAEGSTSGSDRIYYLRSAMEIWSQRPLIGWGAGTYGTMHPEYQYRVISASRDAHNFYVQSLPELGLIGFLLITWLVIEILFGLWRGLKHDPRLVPIALGALAILLHFGVDIDAGYPVILALVAILIALGYYPNKETKGAEATSNNQILIPVAFAASVMLALPLVALFRGSTDAQTAENLQSWGDYPRALDYIQAARSGVIYDPDWVTVAGVSYYVDSSSPLDNKANDLALAAQDARTAIAQDPHDAQHYFLLGEVEVAQGKTTAAETEFKQAIRLDPFDNPQYYNNLASIYVRQNNLVLADQTAAVVTTLYTKPVLGNRNADTNLAPNVALSYVVRAVVAQRLGQITVARSFLNSALAVDPGNSAAKQLQQQIGQ